MANQPQCSGLSAMLTIGYYNGYEDILAELLECFKNSNECCVPMPQKFELINCNEYPRILWSFLVMQYGDYGVSPRYGWIYGDDLGIIIEEFEQALKENSND